jgi:hypothetical protein
MGDNMDQSYMVGDLQCCHFGDSQRKNKKYSFKRKYDYNYTSSISVVIDESPTLPFFLGGGDAVFVVISQVLF